MSMLRCGCFIFIFFLFFIMNGCASDEGEKTAKEGSVSTEEAGGGKTVRTFSIPQVEQEYWRMLFSAQKKVVQAPDSMELRKKLCDMAYFEKNRAIVAIGVGRKTNPANGQPITPGMVRQAAFTDAARWAAYIETWLDSDYQPKFGEISKAIDTQSLVMNEVSIGDSLYVEVAYEYSR